MRGTTKQMTDAPLHAVYVWVNGNLDYPKQLAEHLRRTDLRIVTPGWLETPRNWRGYRLTGLVLDHAARLTGEQRSGLLYLKETLRRRATDGANPPPHSSAPRR